MVASATDHATQHAAWDVGALAGRGLLLISAYLRLLFQALERAPHLTALDDSVTSSFASGQVLP